MEKSTKMKWLILPINQLAFMYPKRSLYKSSLSGCTLLFVSSTKVRADRTRVTNLFA